MYIQSQSRPLALGIFGAGQLARMLAIRAREMGLEVNLYTKNKRDPAVAFCHFWYRGDFDQPRSIQRFIEAQDVVTFESEFVPAEIFSNLSPNLRKKVFPQIENLARLQDRWPQKELLYDFGIPTSPFLKMSSKDDFDLLPNLFPNGCVLKKRFGGYDGFGTFVVRTKAELDKIRLLFKGNESGLIAEQLIAFKSEKSLIFARSRNGDVVNYPMFESKQKNNQCFQVWGPVTHKKEKSLITQITKMLREINYVGVIAFELFDVGSELIVNEIAPRVHNTGHVTMSAFTTSQFDLHLRSVLGMPLDFPEAKSNAFLMQNLIGSTGRIPKIDSQLKGQLHWYEKTENRALRKMGHLNYHGSKFQLLQEQAKSDLRKITI